MKFDITAARAHIEPRVLRFDGTDYPVAATTAREEVRFDALCQQWWRGVMDDEEFEEFLGIIARWVPGVPSTIIERLPMNALREIGLFASTGIVPDALANGVDEGNAPATDSQVSSGPSPASPVTSA